MKSDVLFEEEKRKKRVEKRGMKMMFMLFLDSDESVISAPSELYGIHSVKENKCAISRKTTGESSL